MDKEWTTRRGRLLTTRFCDGRATYRLWHTSLYALRFYLCCVHNRWNFFHRLLS